VDGAAGAGALYHVGMEQRNVLMLLALVAAAASLSVMACRRGARAGDADGPRAVSILAAASTVEVMTELSRQFEQETGFKTELSFAASSVLARQIEAGAPADVYLSADQAWMDYLRERQLLREQPCFDLLANRLVIVVPAGRAGVTVELDAAFDFARVCRGGLAMGDPSHVPAGKYARQALEHVGWWERVQPRVVPAVDVREALRYVAMGEVDAGIVYATDAAGSDAVRVVATLPHGWHDPIRYPIAACAGSAASAERFLEFARSSAAAQIIRRRGFEVPFE